MCRAGKWIDRGKAVHPENPKRRISLASYRIADCVIAAGDQIAAEQSYTGKSLETLD